MLVAAPVRWDEMCFSIPAVRALCSAGIRVEVLCPEAQADIWKCIRGPAVTPYPEKVSAKALAASLSGAWRAAILWEPGTAAEAISRKAVAKRIGPSSKALDKLLTDPICTSEQAGPVEHRVATYLAVVGKLGVDVARPELFESIPPVAAPAENTVLLAPDCEFGKIYEWPLERWLDLGKSLMDTGVRISVAGVPGGRDLGKKLAEGLGEKARFFDTEPLSDALALFQGHRLVVAAEGTLPHIASLAGATCVTLFGPGNPLLRRPMGKRHTVLHRHVECSPCMLQKCHMDLRCQTELTVDSVLAAIRRRLVSPAAA